VKHWFLGGIVTTSGEKGSACPPGDGFAALAMTSYWCNRQVTGVSEMPVT